MSDTAAQKRSTGKRLTVVSSAVLAVVALVLTGFALRYPGLSSSDVEVSNGGVWVTNEQLGLLGRLNVDAGELDARLSSTGQDLDIIQSGYTVLETGPRGITPINTASVTRNGLVELPTGTTVKIGGDRIVITAPDGRVWIVSPEEAAAFSASAVEPVLEAGSSQRPVAVSDDGDVFVLDGTDLLKYPREGDTRDTTAEDPIEVPGISQKAEAVQLSAVGEQPVILDRENSLLRVGTDMDEYSLADHGVSSLEKAELQQSGPTSESFVVSTVDSLFVIPFDGGSAKQIDAGGTGTDVVKPAQVQGCAYGAWGGSKRYVRDCEGQETVAETIPQAEDSGDLTLRVNQDLVVLNDQKFGLSWEIMDSMQLVDNWVINQDIQTNTSQEKEKETLTTTITNIAAERDEENRPPTANEDTFGVRAGKSIVLPVTKNDTDPDGDILTVGVQGDQPSIGTVTPIRGGTQLQIEVAEDAAGTAAFTYQADDGRGGTDTATVNLEVRGEGENSPPEAAEQTITKVQVRSGEEISFNILPYWEDPDGDSFYLANATVAPEDLVTFRPDGLITFNDAGLSPGTKQVQLTFRDENGLAGEGVVEIESVTESDLAPITTADHASVVAGRSTTIKPLVNDLNPNGGDLQLLGVSETGGLEVEPALDAGTIEVTGDTPGTYYLEYTVAASGASTASLGLVRVDVEEPTTDDLKPVAVDDMGTVTTGADTLLDPLENDVDPTGGVLVVNSIDVPDGSGLKATVVNHHLVRVEAEPGAVVSQEPVPVTYEVANSTGTATGTMRVMVASTDTQFANPEAVPDRAVVRAGDMVNIDVTANDVSPTGSDLHLGEIMDTSRADDAGHAESNQDQIRFRAEDDASGEAVVQYEVVDETGRTGSALVHISIVPRDVENTAPQPKNLTARTVAGSTVRIPVSTTGIDPDGDSVMLTGITSPMPSLGEIVTANGEWIEYLPYDDSRGTDRFQYQVMDRHGAIGTAEVLVGVAAPNEVNQAPYAVDDTVEVRPDREVQIPVLDNDTDPEGDELGVVRSDVRTMTEIEEIPLPEGAADDGYLTVVTPSESGTHTVLYSASDGQLKSSATATIKVASNAPLRSPVARDDFVAAEDVMDPETQHIDVDVLANDSDPDGSTNDLALELDGTYEGVEVREDDDTIRIVPQEEQQRIRYTITDVDDLVSAGYIWVPGTAKQAPVWVGPPLEVQAGSEGTIDLADPNNVRVRPGAQSVQITDPSLVTALHSDGSQLVENESTLVYRPADGFSGKDTITVEVTDGAVGDPSAATATLAIPVEVTPEDVEEENLPPTFQGALLEVEQAGPASTLDLSAGAEDPEGEALVFALGEYEAVPEVTIALEGATLTATATSKATKGATLDVPVSVSDGTNPAVPATVQITVGGSQRPEISPALDEVEIDAGSTEQVDVLANDSNPFPDGDRTVTSAALVSGDGEVSVSGDQVTITPAEDYSGILTAQYTVLDDTEDPDREVSGEIRVTVRGLPEAPSAPRTGEIGDGFVELTFNAGADNGAPITGYTVSSASGPAVTQECASTSCTITGLTNDTEYTFQVVATNDVGASDPSAPSAVARPDVRPEKPAAPSVERGDQQLTVMWSSPVNQGSAIQDYEVQIQNTATQEISAQELSGGTTQTVFPGLTNGVDYRFRIRASNLAEEPSDWSEWSRAEHPAGTPKVPADTPSAERVNDPRGGGIEVTWPRMTEKEANGEPITDYIITASSGESQTVDASRTSTTFTGMDQDTEHSFTYTGVNSVGRGAGASGSSNAVTPWAEPSTPTGVSATMPSEGTGDGPNGRASVHWDAANSNGTTITKYVVRWNGGSKTVDGSQTSVDLSGLNNGTSYRFTVEARNGFEANGGVSGPSKQSNSVRPYTSPADPSVSATNSKCTDANSCPVTVKASAGGGDGGAGNKTLQVRIDGGSWKDSSTSFEKTYQKKSGGSVTIEARVVTEPTKADGSTTTMTSGTAKKAQPAQKYTPPPPPEPKAESFEWAAEGSPGYVSGKCESGLCRYIGYSVSGLEPNTTYNMSFTDPTEDNPWGQHELVTDSNGQATLAANQFFYGHPGNKVTVHADGDAMGSTVMPS